MTEAEHYAHEVLSGRIIAGRLIQLACQRFLHDLKRTDVYFDEKEANKMIFFCENHLKQWEGDWQGLPVKLELWQKFHLQQLFGWIKKDTNTRRFTKFYLQVAKKNGKSSECAWLSDFHLFADERIKTPKVFTAANNEDQAKICVNMAGRTIEWSPDLVELVEEGEIKLSTYGSNITEVVHKGKDGFIKALSKEGGDKKAKTSGGKHGINASLGLVDEFGMSPDHGASGSIATSMASRKERLMAYLTTAGFNMEGPCYSELRDQGIKVLECAIEIDNYLPIIYELDPPKNADGKDEPITLQWLLANEQEWYKANPNLDISVQRDYLREMLQNAVALGGTTEVEVMTLNFNRWMDSPDVFISNDVWSKNTHGITEEDLSGQVCYGGIEIVSGMMLNCFCLLFPDVKGKVVIKPVFWMPDAYISSKECDKYRDWVNDGLIITYLGNVSDNDKVVDAIETELSKYNFQSFCFRSNMVHNDIVQALINRGYKGTTISHGRQGISTPTQKWEELITSGQAEHFGNPVLTWMNSNCTAVRKDNDIRLEKSGSRVIGIYAAINALAEWKTQEANQMTNFSFV